MVLTCRAIARQSGDGRSWEWCECRGGCRVVKMCLLNYCVTTTVCSDCAHVHNCQLMTR